MVPERGVASWQVHRRALTRGEFVRRFRHPFLVCVDWEEATQPGPDDTADIEFRTVAIDAGLLASLKTGGLERALVAAVVKSKRNPYEFISLGRASNCDLIFPHASVSKLHAYVKVLSPGEAEITDAGSKNGTIVNGKRIARGAPVRLRSGDELVAGRIPLQFLDVGRFYEML